MRSSGGDVDKLFLQRRIGFENDVSGVHSFAIYCMQYVCCRFNAIIKILLCSAIFLFDVSVFEINFIFIFEDSSWNCDERPKPHNHTQKYLY